jgi:hypothetical protein
MNTSPRPRILFLGDHGSYHCGCRAVSTFIRSRLEPLGEVVTEGPAQIVVVNGEGSMHDGSRDFHQKMQALTRAVQEGIPAHLVNTVWENNPHDYDAVLPRLSSLVVREPFSLRELEERHGVRGRLSPDFSIFAPVEEVVPRLDFRGRQVASDFYSQEFKAFVRVTGGSLGKTPYLDLRRVTWPECVASLRTASVFICGRHHGIYAACRARTPFVPFRGNTRKVEGIFALAGVDIPLCASPQELPRALAWCLENRVVYDRLFDWMEQAEPWTGPAPVAG